MELSGGLETNCAKASCQMQSNLSRNSLETHPETQKPRRCATWPTCACQRSYSIVRVAKERNLHEVPMTGGGNKQNPTALNLYKGQRKPMQKDTHATKVVISHLLSLLPMVPWVVHKVSILLSSHPSSVGFLSERGKWEALTLYTILTYDYYTGLDILITDRRLFLGKRVNRNLLVLPQKLKVLMELLNILTKEECLIIVATEMFMSDITESHEFRNHVHSCFKKH